LHPTSFFVNGEASPWNSKVGLDTGNTKVGIETSVNPGLFDLSAQYGFATMGN
jgi:hypothetical protein